MEEKERKEKESTIVNERGYGKFKLLEIQLIRA